MKNTLKGSEKIRKNYEIKTKIVYSEHDKE